MTVIEAWRDLHQWSFYRGRRDNELAIYDDQHAAVINRQLWISANRTATGWRSSLLYANIPFIRGTLTIPVKAPRVVGMWPAVWFLGYDYNGSNWPQCGEFDALEIPGTKLLTANGGPAFGTNLHGGASIPQRWQSGTKPLDYSPEWFSLIIRTDCDNFIALDTDHGYGATNAVTHRRSDLPAGRVWPFSSKRGLRTVLNVAVGGWADAPDPVGPKSAVMRVGQIQFREEW